MCRWEQPSMILLVAAALVAMIAYAGAAAGAITI
jgi:hypothetical protein